MRLLHTHDFTFKAFQNIPEPYAILSHRWAECETTMEDVQSGRVHPLSMSNKVSSFAQYIKSQSQSLQIEWIWVDSCCIEQSSAAELSEGVNCMFDWYRNASVCIVYLPDVELPSDRVALRKSVWFTRGWTLQELLASTLMVFVTKNWQVIGHKGDATHLQTEVGDNIELLLADVTKIPQAVLQDFSASRKFSIEERMRWMDGRETLKEEDMFYALFGIFGVTPGANYGEKKHRAKRRLLEAIEREEKAENSFDGGSSTTLEICADQTYIVRADKDPEMATWLSAPDPSSNHTSARDCHDPGTCEWLLRHDQYKRWMSGGIKHLWLYGKPGCGKSVLCSTVIEDLLERQEDNPKITVAYFYFTFSDDRKQSYNDLILALVSQLAEREPARSLLGEMRHRTDQTKPSVQSLEKVLIATLAASDGVFIVLDALDESPESKGTRRQLLKRLKSFILQTPKLKLFATSRFIPEICGLMEDLACGEISIQPSDVSNDIQQHVATQLSTEPRLRQFTPAVKSMVERNVIENADGMFRWAFLLLEELIRLKKSSRSAIEAALKRFPKDLDDVYARILEDLDDLDQKDVFSLLYWITYARRPLTLGQLADALTINSSGVNSDDRCAPEDILRLLTSLVVTIQYGNANENGTTDMMIDEATPVRLAHFTVQEYLESSRILAGECRNFHLERRTGHYFLTQHCVTYLMHYSLSNEKKSTAGDFTTFSLLQYAATTWYHHSALHERTDVQSEVKLLESDAARHDWLVVNAPDRSSTWPFELYHNLGPGLYHACYMGLELVARALLENGADVNAKGGHYSNALQAASDCGRLEMVMLLLEHGAHVNAQGGFHGNALRAASSNGHTEVVKLLLEKGAHVNADGDRVGDALEDASEWGHVETVKLLLDAGARPHGAKVGYFGNALQLACLRGHIEVVKLLLANGAQVNSTGGIYGNALQTTLVQGHLEIAKLLLERGADVNIKGGQYSNALQAASHKGHIEMVKLLIRKGACIDAKGGECGNALYAASQGGHIEIARLLLGSGANLYAAGGEHDSALHAASNQGDVEMVKLLLEQGVDVDVHGDFWGRALQAASFWGNVEVAMLLLNEGADVNAKGGYYGNALQAAAASSQGNIAIVKLLLEHGAEVNAEGGEHGTALQAASRCMDFEVIQLLLEKGADVNAQVGGYGSALQLVSFACGDIEVVKLLLENGADVNAQGGPNGSPLEGASAAGHVEVVTLLLEKGANLIDANANGHANNSSALLAASDRGRVEIVKLLLKKGAEIGAEGGQYGNALESALEAALEVASSEGHAEVAKLLLEAGDAGRSNISKAFLGASEKGHTEVAKLLLERGADRMRDGERDIALQLASREGEIEVVKLLLETGANINASASEGEYGNALQAAIEGAYIQVANVLLEKGADVNAVGGPYGNALQATSVWGHTKVWNALLEHRYNVNAEAGEIGKELEAELTQCFTSFAGTLLDKGADVNAQGGYYGNALQAAAASGHIDITKLLLKNGANVNAEGGFHGHALQAAVDEAHHEVVELLRQHGARECKRQKTGMIETQDRP